MKLLKAALTAIVLTATCSEVFAALPAATDPTIVTVPQLPGGFFIGATGFYSQPSDTNGDIDYATSNTGIFPDTFNQVANTQPGYGWNWGVDVGYVFPDTGNDLTLSYFDINSVDSNSIAIPQTVIGQVNPVNPSNLDGTSINIASSQANYKINQVDGTVGQYIFVGCRLILHPNVGVRWIDLERDLATGVVDNNNVASFVYEDSDFQGAGPIVGLDASYYIAYGIGLVGHVDTALLVGDIDANTSVAQISPSQAITNQYNLDNIRRIVPVTDEKLGLNYTFLFNSIYNSDLTLEAGYQVSNYFNSTDRLYGNFLFGNGGAITGHTTSDVGLNGPYISLTYHG